MKNIALIVDTSTSFDKSFLEKDNVFVLNLHTFIEEKEVNVDITEKQFYDTLITTNKIGRTAAPSIGEIIDIFEDALSKFEKVVVFSMSSKMTSTYQTLVLQSNNFKDKIFVIDTLSVWAGVNIQVEHFCKRMNDSDFEIQKVISEINDIKKNIKILLIVDDITIIERGGRIGKAASIASQLLKIKPILSNENGEIGLYKKERKMTKAIETIITDTLNQKIKNNTVYVTECCTTKYLPELVESFTKEGLIVKIKRIPPTITIHSGIGSIVICFEAE